MKVLTILLNSTVLFLLVLFGCSERMARDGDISSPSLSSVGDEAKLKVMIRSSDGKSERTFTLVAEEWDGSSALEPGKFYRYRKAPGREGVLKAKVESQFGFSDGSGKVKQASSDQAQLAHQGASADGMQVSCQAVQGMGSCTSESYPGYKARKYHSHYYESDLDSYTYNAIDGFDENNIVDTWFYDCDQWVYSSVYLSRPDFFYSYLVPDTVYGCRLVVKLQAAPTEPPAPNEVETVECTPPWVKVPIIYYDTVWVKVDGAYCGVDEYWPN